ncbi:MULTISPECIES: hypothetical protein [unclassified Achromobacter]|uniref:hypothetical protein n=1 Tax=unclassified Achromobacter TaxID=2626865 RepID=UPI000B51D59D|nr:MULTISPECIES: hypothetical protein [unclassified Achromobacter]OWT75446.1 hypothetical protein CEY04_17825 [Achromobacter sp. HZ28]OWT76106.1 hypothetical protein CEY05_13275 [Achromobacter sp. HZ34]
MGHIAKKVVDISKSGMKKIDPLRGGDAILEANGIPTFTGEGSANVFDMGRTAQAEAAAAAAAQQAQATRDAANLQAQTARDTANQQAASIRDQASAQTAAQVAAINQQAQAAQIAAAAAAAPQEGTPDVQLSFGDDENNPRRRYQGGSSPSIGGTAGGVGIRI